MPPGAFRESSVYIEDSCTLHLPLTLHQSQRSIPFRNTIFFSALWHSSNYMTSLLFDWSSLLCYTYAPITQHCAAGQTCFSPQTKLKISGISANGKNKRNGKLGHRKGAGLVPTVTALYPLLFAINSSRSTTISARLDCLFHFHLAAGLTSKSRHPLCSTASLSSTPQT